ncbi:hypothetical protein EYF80_043705 [Liparis tanakae]|uniref:Uncharacterized protein n=1 Tax=Liparis tanakae TaxID=230148 RepID=A0A4Z2FXV5_9TELE|nr:hypothetical protein EYF80_043705 [Liparis tanakae]
MCDLSGPGYGKRPHVEARPEPLEGVDKQNENRLERSHFTELSEIHGYRAGRRAPSCRGNLTWEWKSRPDRDESGPQNTPTANMHLANQLTEPDSSFANAWRVLGVRRADGRSTGQQVRTNLLTKRAEV